MVIYFADRRMNILSMATTELMEGYTISRDLKTEDTDTGVATFECTVHWTDDTRAIVKAAATAGNYLLRSNNGENEFYTIIESEEDTKDQTIYIYAEDAGMDLLNETVGAFAADEAHPIAWYVEKYAEDTGFEIGINEIADLSRKLEWTGTATAAERIASVATQFDNAEISYTFDIKGLTITHKYINIHKKRGKDAGVQLRLNRDVDRIITTTSVADLATALYVTGGIPEDSEDPITLEGYEYDDGDMYVEEGLLKSREALKVWSRYVWAKEPGQIEGYTGHIIKQWSYDTTSQSELCNRAITQLGKVCEPAVNYEIDIQMLPENVAIGDYVDIVDEKGELYLNSRILKLTTSVCEQQQTATLGEFLIKESGISETVRELAEQFSQLAKSRQYYVWIVYADDEYGDGISLDPEGKAYMGTCTTSAGPDPDLSNPNIYKWSLIQGENGVGIAEINTYYGVSDSPTDVPTEWQEEPYELLHNQYQWSYTETIYTNGVIELTSPTIIAYYDYLEVDELEARVAHIEEAYVSYEEVELLVADDVEAAIINAGFLTADSALILELTAFSENVYTLLGGEGAFGELQSIHLTSDNAVIDYAVIANAVAGTLMAELITATYIDTDVITIMSEDGGITIIGNQIQITTGQTLYYDENGNLRIQIGQDASGNFSFIIYDETGTGIMMDSEGIHESAVPDGLIVDSMVSDNAAIQGSKLDIASVAQCLTEDGTLELSASQVTINDTTLDAWYTNVTQTLEGLEGLTSEGLMNVEPWFCLWSSDTEAPPDDEDLTDAICGVAVCGTTICGLSGGTLWVDYDIPVTDGLYKWVKWKGYYADGHEEWSIPYCLTDGYLRTETSVLQTQLEVVQGEITAKVWLTDITEEITVAMTDMWSEINITLDGIEAQVGEMSTESLRKATEYFCLWYSGTEPPPDASSLTPAICGVAVCGLTICGLTNVDNFWTTEEPVAGEGEYKWIRYYFEYADGHTEWGDPYCLTDDFSREQFESLYSDYLVMETRVAGIEITVDNITSTVSYVQQSINGLESSMNEQFSQIEQTTNSITSTVVDLQSTVSSQGEQITSNTSQITQLTDSITSTVTDIQQSINELGTEVSGAYSQIEQLADSISAEIVYIEDNYATSASLVLQYNSETGHAELIGDADYIYLYGNQIVIQSDNFTLTEDGTLYAVNAYLEGTVEADSGHIGGFTIGASAIYNGKSSFSSTSSGVYIGTDGISLGSGFSVTQAGSLTASSGAIGGWTIGNYSIWGGSEEMGTTAIVQIPRESDADTRYWVFAAGGSDHSNHSDCKFRVGSDGQVYTEYITATGGTVGGWNITSTRIRSESGSSIGTTPNAFWIVNESDRPWLVASDANSDITFEVDRDGSVIANDFTSGSTSSYSIHITEGGIHFLNGSTDRGYISGATANSQQGIAMNLTSASDFFIVGDNEAGQYRLRVNRNWGSRGYAYITDPNYIGWGLPYINYSTYQGLSIAAGSIAYINVTWGKTWPTEPWYMVNVSSSNDSADLTARVRYVSTSECGVLVRNNGDSQVSSVMLIYGGIAVPGWSQD